MNRKMATLAFFCGILAFFAPNMGIAAENHATVLSVSPHVVSHLGGKTNTLAVKMKLPVSSTVISDIDGRAQLMFPDTTTVSIAPSTEIALSEFVDTPNEENIVINMATGTARFITGEVSRRKPSAMTVNTPQVVVGIRGTMVTIMVIGDTTKIYLTETSGLGVTVTNRKTGETRKMIRPGNMITVGPSGMIELPGELSEVRKMTVDLHTAPKLAYNQLTQPQVVSITPTGSLSPVGSFDSGMNPVPAPAGLSDNLIVGHYSGNGGSSNVFFDVDLQAKISGAGFDFGPDNFSGSGGSGQIRSDRSFLINNFIPGGNTISASMNGQFTNSNGGNYYLLVNDVQTAAMPNQIDDNGTFGKK